MALRIAAFEAVPTLLHHDALQGCMLRADDAVMAYAAVFVVSEAFLECWWIRVVVVAFNAGLETETFTAAQDRIAENH